MKEEDIPDYNIFMMCEALNTSALSELSAGYHIRQCRRDELELWKAFPFNSSKVPAEYEDFMNRFVNDTYGENLGTFLENTLFVCTSEGEPIATCSHWKSYGKINSIHWFKTRRDFEGRGIGRALLSAIMRRFKRGDYPIYLHTQPSSFRAIKLYSDLGFQLLSGGRIATRENDLDKCLPILKEFMPKAEFERLKISETPSTLVELMKSETTVQF